jgi:deoxyribonuclease-4
MQATTLQQLRNYIAQHHLSIFIHGPYAINPAHGLSKPQQIQCIVDNLHIADQIGAAGVIIHVPKQLDYDMSIALDNTRQFLRHVLDQAPVGPHLILETASGQGTEMFRYMFDLFQFTDTLEQEYRQRIRFCIDTCHIFAAGHNIADPHTWDQLHQRIPWDQVALIHLNDSKHEAGSRKDRHEHWNQGHLAHSGYAPALLASLFHLDLPLILETPDDWSPLEEIAHIREIVHQYRDEDQESNPDSVS